MLDAGFATLEYLKSRILPDAGSDDTQWDLALGKLGLAVAARFETHCNRHLQRLTAASEITSARTLSVSLKAYPVITLTSAAVSWVSQCCHCAATPTCWTPGIHPP